MDMSQYLGIFLDEGREQLDLLEAHVLQMERGDHSADTLNTLFRAAHTLKGSSRTMSFLAIGDLTHEMENVLDDLRNEKLSVSTPIVNALLDCLDALGALLDAVAATGSDADAPGGKDIPALVARLSALRAGSGADASAGPTPAAAPAATPAATTSTALVPPEHVRTALDHARDAGLHAYQIAVTLDANCVMKSVRVFMALGALEPLGTVLFSSPSEDELDEEQFDRDFALLFAAEAAPADIERALAGVSEIERVAVTFWPEPGTSDDASATEPVRAAAAAVPVAEEVMPAAASPTPAAPQAPAPTPAAAPASQTIRVDVARLDNLLNLIGELVIDRTQIARLGNELQGRYPQDERAGQLVETTHRVARITAELQDEIMKVRMLPIDGVFQRLPRMVRDLAQKTGKEVEFVLRGGETELDRSVLDSLGDPLIHLLRNSVDHGIEAPPVRTAAGKSARGRVTLSARHQENQIVIEIEDDGAGIDPAKIRAAAVQKGLVTQTAADALTDRDAVMLIFAPGFSTAAVLSDISGRGVGMDIVKSNLEKLGGRVFVDSRVGQGSRFRIVLPLTLAIARALLVRAGGGTYVLPLSSVVEMLRLGQSDEAVRHTSGGGQTVMLLRGRTVPLACLADVLCGDPQATQVDRIAPDAYVVVIGLGERQIGLCVDALLGEQDVVIKSLGTLLGDVAGLSGATILGDGRVALIVDIARAIETLGRATAAENAVLAGGAAR